MNTNINNFKIYNKVLTSLQKACHLLGSASAIHMVSEQYPKPKHQIELFCLKKNETLILHGFKHMTTYILIEATYKYTFFCQIHKQFLYFTYVCNQKKKSTTKGRGVKTSRSFFFFELLMIKLSLNTKEELGQERVRKCCLNYVLYGNLWLYLWEKLIIYWIDPANAL